MNAMYLIYVPVAVFFFAFVVYAGLIMPAKEITESVRDRNRPRGPDHGGDADVIALHTARTDDEKVAA